jgi:hypothetical protein
VDGDTKQIAASLEGVFVVTEAEAHWVPFVVTAPGGRGNDSMMQHLRHAIGATKAKLTTRKIQPKSTNAFEKIIKDAPEDAEAKLKNATELLLGQTARVCEIKFPRTYKTAPVFICGIFHESEQQIILCGVYAVLVDS